MSACVVIEFVDRETFLGACLGLRWSRAAGHNIDSWEGVLRGKWIALALQQTQYDFREVDPSAAATR